MKRLIPLLIVFLIMTVGVFLVISTNKNPQEEDKPPPKPEHKLSYAGSIGIGKDKVELGVASLRQNYGKLNELSLYWYNLDSDNRITLDESVSEETEEETVAFAKQNGEKVLFGISDHGEAEKADDILIDEDKQKKHIAKIISIMDAKEYDGVIIDYEELESDQEKDFTKYMQNLSEEVHSKGKSLGISIPVETKREVSHGINIVDVSKVVEKMHMNIYEESGQETGPAPIASIGWANVIIKNAIDQGVEPNKIMLGTAHSGHDWIVEPNIEFFKDMHTRESLGLLSNANASAIWDEEKQTNYFEYTDDEGRKHVVWLEDARSFKSKIDLAKSYELQGMFIWYLGGEDPEIFKQIY